MRKKFKAKKKKKSSRIVVIFICIYIFSQLLLNVFNNIRLNSNNEEFLKQLMYNSNHYLNYEKEKGVFTNIVNYVLNVDFSNPLSIVSKTFSYEEEAETIFMANAYLEDPNKEIINNPKIYIYNSHQGEGYSKENYENHSINPGVMMASYLLKEKLNNLGVPTIAEEGNISEFMATQGYTHAYSYVASRYFIEPVITDNKFDLIIDLHRDSIKKADSTVVINGKSYAKTLFVVGLENKDYQKNLDLTTKIDKIIKENYPGLSRGIYKKEGEGVDGVYNQDLNPNMILLELGGYQNTISEVNNTVEAISKVIKIYMESL